MKIRIGNKIKEVTLLSKEDNKVKISVDDKEYDLDIVMAENGLCSIITQDGRSFNAEVKPANFGTQYSVSMAFNTFDVEILNSYRHFCQKDKKDVRQANISSPMPGKVVKILVKEGDTVTSGTSVIIIEAMKMQSEYKVTADSVIKRILVAEGDNISGNQVLIELGDLPKEEA